MSEARAAAVEAIRAFCDRPDVRRASGGVLHIVLEDYNVEDHWLERSARNAWAENDGRAIGVVEALLVVPEDDRIDLIREATGRTA